MTGYIPSIDLRPWYDGGTAGRRQVAVRVDHALQTAGFLLVTGHGVDPALRAEVRALARMFFELPEHAKKRYAVSVGGRGWIPPGAEANGYAEGTVTPADLKESYSLAADDPTGDPEVDEVWFRPNVWPAEVPALRSALTDYLARMRTLSDDLMSVCAAALGLPDDHFAAYLRHPTFGFNLNWYPALQRVGPAATGQYRIGPHTDFGTVTVLDREPGLGGLQVYTVDGRWVDAPFDEDAFTINIGDLMARWTGDRWRSTRHRVLAPPADAPEEELLSLVYFYEADHDAVIESLPVGTRRYPPVVWSEYLRAKLAAISLG
ncbi:MAG TPA: 2-oxoglutarate and iron-dependent oxygenase domain-containing protein [Pseudonocardiaceae bacterium]|jgi:isopenicillin N synthase-like dioxygenase|nr:2-oxoglutarate and iron-dependent oxygenase domain-containing protein [Pseudonocardiaceae bacterium]